MTAGRELTIVRCPKCGSTDAGEDGGAYEFTHMRCPVCGYDTYCDEYQLKDDWNVHFVLPEGERLPPFVEPALANPCFRCRGREARPEELAPLRHLHAMSRCRWCRVCWRDVGDGAVARVDVVTSIALCELSAGELTHHALRALAAFRIFDAGVLELALGPDVDLAPLLAWQQEEADAGRAVRWSLLVLAARAGVAPAALAPFVPALARAIDGTLAAEPDAAERAYGPVLAALADAHVDVSGLVPIGVRRRV